MILDISINHTAIIGLYENEQITPQAILIEAKIDYIYENEMYLDYKDIVDFITDDIDKSRYLLLEEAVSSLNNKIFQRYSKIDSIKLAICKKDILNNAKVFVSDTKNRDK